MAVKQVTIQYTPRRAFLPFHQRTQRWSCLVCHRRAGKTVAAVNDMIKRAIEKPGPYAYIAPFRAQAKSVAWDYFKRYAAPVMEQANEAELKIKLINSSTISLFGADNADAMRGHGFGGAYCDEYGDFRPSVWGNVIRPTLSDRLGWAVFAGTPKGHNQFYDTYKVAVADPKNWHHLLLKASESGITPQEELDDARRQLSEDQYNQEYECSFDAALVGAFYGVEMAAVDREGRIRTVDYDPDYPVNTAWDLGRTDDTAIWWYQNIGNEVHIIDFFSESGGSIEDYAEGEFRAGSLIKELTKRPYKYGRHWLPHDAKAKTLASDGKSIVEKMAKYVGFESLAIVPNLAVQDGIQAARTVLPRCYFDLRCDEGIEALRQYQREYDEDKKVFRKTPLHSWASHGADAFRYLSIVERRKPEGDKPAPPNVFPDHLTVTLDELFAEREEKLLQRVRI